VKTGQSKGIYTRLFDPATGELGSMELAVECPSPANLIVHPSKRFLYACIGMSTGASGEFHVTDDGSSPISAFAIDGARLRKLNTVSAGGILPTHGVVDRTGRNLLVSFYRSGHSAVFRLNEDGSIGERTAKVWSPAVEDAELPLAHPHITILSQNERFAIVAEMGTDQCVVYRFDPSQGTLTYHGAAVTPPGAGPRHVAFHPSHKFAYSSNEHGGSVTAFSWDEETGALEAIQTITTLPAGFGAKNRVSDIRVHPSGGFLYAANRGHESIAIFSIDPVRGTLLPAGHAPTSGARIWAITIDPTGGWMLLPHVNTDNIAVFPLDRETGALMPPAREASLSAPSHVVLV
jgi:6-phosphogluconolactonase